MFCVIHYIWVKKLVPHIDFMGIKDAEMHLQMLFQKHMLFWDQALFLSKTDNFSIISYLRAE
jgi:hypothetical protein